MTEGIKIIRQSSPNYIEDRMKRWEADGFAMDKRPSLDFMVPAAEAYDEAKNKALIGAVVMLPVLGHEPFPTPGDVS